MSCCATETRPDPQSFIRMEAERAEHMCRQSLVRLQGMRENHRISDLKRNAKKIFIRTGSFPFLGRRMETLEETEKRLTDEAFYFYDSSMSHYGREDQKRINRLLSLAKQAQQDGAGSKIFLCGTDSKILEYYTK